MLWKEGVEAKVKDIQKQYKVKDEAEGEAYTRRRSGVKSDKNTGARKGPGR